MGGCESTTRTSLQAKPKVVIVGAGYAGIHIASLLDDHVNVILVDRKDYHLHNVATPRAMVDVEFAPKCFVPYDKLLHNGIVLRGEVAMISPSSVTFASGQVLEFDYLVIATGTSYAFPYKVPTASLSNVLSLYEEVAEKIKTAEHIVCVGGGPTGIESAAEIKERYPDKVVTLIHNKDTLMPGWEGGDFEPQHKENLKTQLEDMGVKLLLGDRVNPVTSGGSDPDQKYIIPESKSITTEKGETIDCDLLFWCVGGKVNSSSYEAKFSEALNDRKMLRVNAHMQVEGFPKVFAAGDCCSAGPIQAILPATAQSDVVAANIRLLAADPQTTSLKSYEAGAVMNITTLGTQGGSFQGPFGWVFGAWAAQAIKGDMFTGKTWKELGHKDVLSKERASRSCAAASDEGHGDYDEKTHLTKLFPNLTDQQAEEILKGHTASLPGRDHT